MYELKDSGYGYIGQIPQHWDAEKIKYHFRFRAEKNRGDSTVLSLYRELGIVPKDSRDDNHNITSEDTSNYRFVRVGDFVINKMKAWQGSMAVSDHEGIVSPAYYVYEFTDRLLDKRYFHYLVRNKSYAAEFMRMSAGIRVGQWDLPRMALENTIILIPPMAEQVAIAAFLDEKCTEIEALIADVQAQIDALEKYKQSVVYEAVTKGLNPDAAMRDSGIEWVGKIPNSWSVMPNKYIMHKVKEICPVYDGQDILSLTVNGVVVRDLDAGGKMPTSFDGYQRLRKGNLLMCLFDIDVTPRCIGLIKNNGLSSPAYSQFTLHDNAVAEYYYYYYLMVDYTKELLHMAKNLRHSLTEDQLGAISVPVPPVEVQWEIAHYLDDKVTEIDGIIVQKKEQLSVLEAYKKSLIYEYVTGKKEVPAPITAVMVDPNVILLGKLPKLLSQQKGKIYNQKVLYLLNTYLGLNLGVQYYRYKHGPYDIMLDSYIDTLVENGWCVKSVNNGAENLEIGPNYGAFEKKYGSYFSERDAEINSLIQFVQPMKRSQIERVATLFAVWNDMILDGNNTPTDAEIVSEVMSGWTENKANFAYDTWVNTLNKMRINGIVPKGQGLHTLPRDC